MDADFKTRQQVNLEQMNGLLEFMQEHPNLAKGLIRGQRGKLHSVTLWNKCAKKLNPCKDGASKDGKGWSKYWCGWKYRVRRKALELKAAKDNNRPPPDDIVPLSQMEECILGLIGENAVDGVVIKSDPLADGDTDPEDLNDNNEGVSSDTPYYDNSEDKTTHSKPKRGKRRRCARELAEVDDPGSPPERKPRFQVNGGDSDTDDEARAFLRLERQKLESTQQLTEAVRAVTSEVARLGDVLTQIKDCLLNRFNT